MLIVIDTLEELTTFLEKQNIYFHAPNFYRGKMNGSVSVCLVSSNNISRKKIGRQCVYGFVSI